MTQETQKALQLIRSVLDQISATKQQHIDIDNAFKVVVDEIELENKKGEKK